MNYLNMSWENKDGSYERQKKNGPLMTARLKKSPIDKPLLAFANEEALSGSESASLGHLVTAAVLPSIWECQD